MKLATLALVVSILLFGGLAAAANLGVVSLPWLSESSLGGTLEQREVRTPEQPPSTGSAVVPVPTGFRGPTGKPTVHGPSGPPPSE